MLKLVFNRSLRRWLFQYDGVTVQLPGERLAYPTWAEAVQAAGEHHLVILDDNTVRAMTPDEVAKYRGGKASDEALQALRQSLTGEK